MTSAPILFIIDDFGQGGAQRQIAMMVSEFVRRGRKIVVARYAERDFLGNEIASAGAEVVRLKGRGRVGWLYSLARLVNQRKPAVVCAFLTGPAALALLSNRFKRWSCPVVVCERCTDPEGPVTIKRRLNLALYRGASAIVCNSMRQAGWLERNCPMVRDRITYIGNSVDLDVFKFSPHRSEVVCKFVVLGRVVEAKGVAILARALDLLRARPEDPELLPIAWHGQQYQQGPDLCAAAGASSNGIVFLPPVENVSELIRNADAVLLPSISGEGTPNVVLESMAIGRVVITTDVGDSARLVLNGSTGWVVPPADPEALADALVAASDTDEETIQQMTQAARMRAEEIASIDRIVDEYEALFDNLKIDSKRKVI